MSSSCSGEPVFGGEDGVADGGGSSVEDGVVAELEEHFDLAESFLPFVLGIEDLLDELPHESVVGVAGGLNKSMRTETRKKPRMHHLIECRENT